MFIEPVPDAGEAKNMVRAFSHRPAAMEAWQQLNGSIKAILAAAARCFFSKVLDAVGAQPDREFEDLEPDLRDALVVGRPISG